MSGDSDEPIATPSIICVVMAVEADVWVSQDKVE
jgi:hypothetical protein